VPPQLNTWQKIKKKKKKKKEEKKRKEKTKTKQEENIEIEKKTREKKGGLAICHPPTEGVVAINPLIFLCFPSSSFFLFFFLFVLF
jgi:hypothetical protein